MRRVSLNPVQIRSAAPILAATLVLILMLWPESAFAVVPACGSVLTINTVLTGDMNCTSTAAFATALILGANGITLDLNGHTISGPFSPGTGSEGIVVNATSNDLITCHGGTIKGFDVGIDITGNGNTVKHCHLMDNTNTAGVNLGTAIVMRLGASGNRIIYNDLSSNNCIGIFIDNGASNQIIGNAITGANTPFGTLACSTNTGGVAIELHIAPGTIVRGNALNNNTNGIVSDGFSSETITGNDVSGNLADAMALNGGATISGNQVNANGRDGIAVGEQTFTIMFNTADSNGRYGIAVGGGRGAAAGNNNTTKNNVALSNGTLDLFWDLNGTGNTWTANICDTENVGVKCIQ